MIRELMKRCLRRTSGNRSRRRHHHRVAPHFFEPLEPRLVLDGAVPMLPPAIVVGRTLSAYTTAAVQNNQLDITYTVYNQQAELVTGVLLTDTLQPGVTFESASQLPDRNGQELAWSLGTIEGFERTSLTLTVSLSDLSQPIDVGAHTFATLNAGMVTDSAPAVVLRQGAVDPALLASTPDANTIDPFIQEKAAALDYDPQRIFAYLRDEVSYESYVGSLRGARGTLWSSAGNALDEASLGVALFRASGIPARYAQGTLSDPVAQQLILSMFPVSFQTVGYIPEGTELADPANDPQLLAETRQHYWIQFDTGSGFQDIDTTFANMTVGQTFASATGTFTEVADALRHKVTVRLNAETYSQAGAALTFGGGLNTKTVLSQTFNTLDLVGKPLTIGNLINTQGIPSPIFVSKTTTFTPYLIVGGESVDSTFDELITGLAYQEVQTNFPLGTQLLTGLFVDVDVLTPGGAVQQYQRTIADRIGTAGRHGGIASVTVDPNGPPLLNDSDFVTLSFMPGRYDSRALTAQVSTLNALQQRLIELSDVVAATPAGAARIASQVQVGDEFRKAFISAGRSRLALFNVLSDANTESLQTISQVRAYFDSPRITIFSSRITEGAEGTATIDLAIDLRKDNIRVYAHPGNAQSVALSFNIARGLAESEIEAMVIGDPTPTPDSTSPVSDPVGALRIFEAAESQGIPLVALSPGKQAPLDALAIPSDVKALIADALHSGNLVFLPTSPVMMNGQPHFGWYEINTETGETIGVLESGQHGSSVEYFGLQVNLAVETPAAQFWYGVFAGLGVTSQINLVVFVYKLFAATGLNTAPNGKLVKDLKQNLWSNIQAFISRAKNLVAGTPLLFQAGFEVGFYISSQITTDPPAVGHLGTPNFPLFSLPRNPTVNELAVPATLPVGSIQANLNLLSLQAQGQLTASWAGSSTSGFWTTQVSSLTANVLDAGNNLVGSGTVSLLAASGLSVGVSGNVSYDVNGHGILAFYPAASSNLAVSGDWSSYSADLSGTVNLDVETDALLLNGSLLPAGRYTITTAAATLVGSGASTSPDFAGLASLTASNAVVVLGSGTGDANVEGNPLDPRNGFSLTGYAGTIEVTAGAVTDSVVLNGTATQLLRVAGNPATRTTDQNTATTFSFVVETSLTDEYILTAQAPSGWAVSIDNAGAVTAIPSSGLQSGNIPIQLTARSQTNPDLVAQGEVIVTVTPTKPGITLEVNPDSVFTVPFQGAQVPSAFRAEIHNLGAFADTVTITFPKLPAGFTVLNSGTSVTIPAGETGTLGIYLQPSGNQLPSPGTQVSFDITATSNTNSSITQTQTINFTVPEIHGVTLIGDQLALNTAPGVGVDLNVTLNAVGNVAEGVTLTTSLSNGLNISGLNSPIQLELSGTVHLPLTITTDDNIPLNSNLSATIIATFSTGGELGTQTLSIPIRVVVPGADASADASASADQLGLTDLANRLDDFAVALTDLVLNPSSAVFKNQSLAALDSILAQLNADPCLAHNTDPLIAARGQLAAAVGVAEIDAAARALGTTLDNLAVMLRATAEHGFEVRVQPKSAEALPQSPATFNVILENTGAQTTTYDLSVNGLPASVIAAFSKGSITLPAGGTTADADNAVRLELTQTGNELIATGFTIMVTPREAPAIACDNHGLLTVRDEFIRVLDVRATPPFIDPGGMVAVSARAVNALNRQQQVLGTFVVKDAGGQTVFTSAAVPVTLTVLTTLTTLDLGDFDTTGLARGDYTVEVTLTTSQGQPIPGGSGQGTLLVGSPVTASLTVGPTTVPQGDATVSNTLQVDVTAASSAGLPLLGAVNTSNAGTTVALRGNIAYVGGNGFLSIVDVSDPANPVEVRSFRIRNFSGQTFVQVVGDRLFVLCQVTFIASPPSYIIYSLADPLNPVEVEVGSASNSTFSASDVFFRDPFVFFPTNGITFTGPPEGDITDQFGNFDVENAVTDQYIARLFDEPGRPLGRNQNLGLGVVNPNLVYVAGTNATGGDTHNGSGRLLVVDITDPANLQRVRQLDVPNTATLLEVAVQGNRALVVGSTRGFRDPFGGNGGNLGYEGNVTLTLLDITDPLNPAILSTTTTSHTLPNGLNESRKIGLIGLGDGLFALSQTLSNGDPKLLIIDANDPAHLGLFPVDTPSLVHGLEVIGSRLYAATATGLSIYDIGQFVRTPVIASVQIPNGTGVTVAPSSFNVAPDEVVSGADFDTLIWRRTVGVGTNSLTLTWQSAISGLLSSEARQVTAGAAVDFTSQATTGAIALPPTQVAAEQIIGLAPGSKTVRPAEQAEFDVTVHNPTNGAVAYALSVQGVPSGWVELLGTVTIGPQATVTLPLRLISESFATLGEFGFIVSAVGDNGARGTVQGALILTGDPTVLPDPEAHGVVVELAVASATAGQGTSVAYPVRLINTGSATETFDLSVAGLPTQVVSTFTQTSVTVPPGSGNFREVTLLLTPQPGTPVGIVHFDVTATAQPSVSDTVGGTLDVLANGVDVAIDRTSATPGSTLQLSVTNSGQIADTFDLSLAGPGALVATLGTSQITLAPGGSQTIPIATTAVNFAMPGNLNLTAIATSHSIPAVSDSAMAELSIENTVGLRANFDPDSQLIAVPGTSSFLLLVNNTGNTEDAYTAEIGAVSGSIEANLVGLNGELAETIPLFRLPGLSTGALVLQTRQLDPGPGTVRVTVRSLSDGAIVAEDIAHVFGLRESCPWNNPVDSQDTNFDRFVSPLDVLVLINQLNEPTLIDLTGRLAALNLPQMAPPPFYDVNCDTRLTPVQDVLPIVNFLNRRANGEGEGAVGRQMLLPLRAPEGRDMTMTERKSNGGSSPAKPQRFAAYLSVSANHPEIDSRMTDCSRFIDSNQSESNVESILDDIVSDIVAIAGERRRPFE